MRRILIVLLVFLMAGCQTIQDNKKAQEAELQAVFDNICPNSPVPEFKALDGRVDSVFTQYVNKDGDLVVFSINNGRVWPMFILKGDFCNAQR